MFGELTLIYGICKILNKNTSWQNFPSVNKIPLIHEIPRKIYDLEEQSFKAFAEQREKKYIISQNFLYSYKQVSMSLQDTKLTSR